MPKNRKPKGVVFPIIADLRKAREAKSLSQEQVALKIGYAKSCVAEAELGKRSPRIDLILCWAEALGYDIVLQERA